MQKNPKLEFTNERLTYFTKVTIQNVVYVIEYSVLPKMFSKVLIFCFEFQELSHSTRDLSQTEKKINVVTS